MGDLAKAFLRMGRIGFWAQVGIGVVSVAMAISAIVLDRRTGMGTRDNPTLIQYLTGVSLLGLAFTTAWSYRYILLADRIADPARGLSMASLRQIVWTGVAASAMSLVLSMLIILFEAVQLFLYFLRAPQAGINVIQTTDGPATWVSAGDILSLTVVILMTFIEVLVLALGLWLLFTTTTYPAEEPAPQEAHDEVLSQ
ncbi:DUF3611 family protein [Microvirga lotononidis]|uniref:Uncharacterized protein n=1 Tax=Microvirga lotononidis TaxID=864069 RepID=I4Z209_9HYPH|nr:DUF3611 family protein [Microvirga lotononidis]EIM30251.1 Protein of unknown function (DUF3611) [Microvirga lotononidis]WQO31534.1 DUF3611 family protein [Microvirga lotononidis]